MHNSSFCTHASIGGGGSCSSDLSIPLPPPPPPRFLYNQRETNQSPACIYKADSSAIIGSYLLNMFVAAATVAASPKCCMSICCASTASGWSARLIVSGRCSSPNQSGIQPSFWMQNSSFWMQNSSFFNARFVNLTQNSSFLIQLEAICHSTWNVLGISRAVGVACSYLLRGIGMHNLDP